MLVLGKNDVRRAPLSPVTTHLDGGKLLEAALA
jgi:hypothetical protein